MPRMLKIPVSVDNKPADLLVSGAGIGVAAQDTLFFHYSEVRSLHLKNTETYLMKIRTDSSAVVLGFRRIQDRDLAKALIQRRIIPPDTAVKRLRECSPEADALFESIASVSSNIQGKKELLEKAGTGGGLYAQQPTADMLTGNILDSFTQTTLDVFLATDYSLNQFCNLLAASYFYDVKNKCGPLDRLISEAIRGYSSEVDYATRINSYSVMMQENKEFAAEERVVKRKKADVVAPCPVQLQGKVAPKGEVVGMRILPLECSFEPRAPAGTAAPAVDPKSLEFARDLCWMAYRGDHEAVEAAPKYGASLVKMIKKELGEEGVAYVARLDPRFYCG